jgi:hypothetical protein
VGGDQLHIGGERAAAFRELVGDLDPRRVLLVGIDVAKASWFVLGATCTAAWSSTGPRWRPTAPAWVGWVACWIRHGPGSTRSWWWSGWRPPATTTRRWPPTSPTAATCCCGWSTPPRSRRSARPSATGAARPTGWTRPRSVACWSAAKDRRCCSATTPRPRCGRCGTAARTSWTHGPGCGCRSLPWSTACGRA